MQPTSTDPTGLQLLANKAKLAFFTYDVAANQFTYLNPAFVQLFKMTKENAVNPEALLKMVHPEDQQHVTDTYHELLEEKTCEEIEIRIQLPEQRERCVRLAPFLSGDAPEQRRIVGYVEDITASKQYIDYLKRFRNKKDSALHILAHDLAGPLGIIESLSGALTEETKAYESQQINKLIGLIAKTSIQGGRLIKNLISHEFLETTGVDLIKRRANLVASLEEVIEQYRQSEERLKKTFQFFPSSREVFIEFDDVKLMQAVSNLISNSIKFTHEDGVITVSLEEKQDTVVIWVEDNGVGIPKEYHDTLFDKFTNARRPGLEGEPTTGLGMSIIKTIVEWHNGQIWFDSEEGKGTTFFIELPKE